jgi:hypothetical protein
MNMKILATLPFLITVFVSPIAFSECAPDDSVCIHCSDSIDKGRAGWIVPLIVHLEPGQTVVEQWDFTECRFGIQNFTLYVQPPNNVKDSLFSVTATNISTGDVGINWLDPLTKYFAYADCSVIELTITLSATSKKNADVQVQYTAAFGNLPICQ